jgi:hypothetical protein
MPKAVRRKINKLPDMTDWSDQQIHEFWKSHDSADYWEETKPVQVVAIRRQRVVPVRLDERDIISLKKLAQQLGVDPALLIRRWIKEKLQAAIA